MSETQKELEQSLPKQPQSGDQLLPDLLSVYEKELTTATPETVDNIKTIKKDLSDYDISFQKDILQALSLPGTLQRLSSTGSGFAENIGLLKSFIKKKSFDFLDFTLADIKTYIEQDIDKKQKNDAKRDAIITQVNDGTPVKQKEGIMQQIEDLATQKDDDADNKIEVNTSTTDSLREKATQVLKSITDKITAQKQAILQDKNYLSAKNTFQQQLGTPVSDDYFVMRFALDGVSDQSQYLRPADLGGLSKEQLITTLNQQYGIREIITTNSPSFVNNQFDGLVSAETKQRMIDGKGGLDNLYTIAETEFFQKDTTMRTSLDNLVTKGLFPGAKASATQSIPTYRHETPDGKQRVPTQALQTPFRFETWMQQKNLPATLQAQYMRFYEKEYTTLLATPENDRTTTQKLALNHFLTNLALIESVRYRASVQEASTKAIAEKIFGDISMITTDTMKDMHDWKLVKPKNSDTYTQMDEQGNITLQYDLHGIPGVLSIAADGTVSMEPTVGQEAGYADLITKKQMLGRITGVQAYVDQITAKLRSEGERWKSLTPDTLQNTIRDCIKEDKDALDTTKASMQTTIVRQQFLDTVWGQSTNPSADRMKNALKNSPKEGEKIVVKGVDRTDYPQFIRGIYEFTTTSSKNETMAMMDTYTMLQDYLVKHPDLSVSQKIKSNPEYIATVLNQTPMPQWKELIHVRDKQLAEQKQQAVIDDELKKLEERIDENYQ